MWIKVFNIDYVIKKLICLVFNVISLMFCIYMFDKYVLVPMKIDACHEKYDQ